MKCKNCGEELPEGAVRCPKCGSEIEWVPEYMSADMQRVKLHRQREEEEERLAREAEEARIERMRRHRTPAWRAFSLLLAVLITAALSVLANLLISESSMNNYGYLKTMAERALDAGNISEAEYDVERAKTLRDDSSDLTALVQKIDTLKTEDAYVQDS